MFYTIDKYQQDVLRLTNSLVIKIIDVAIAMNKGVIASGYTVSDNPLEWKYYLNISGQKHITNNDVQLIVIETGMLESLTPELLNNYSYTKTELLKQENYYEELMSKYPSDTLYIKGCITPCDINKAITADDGSILSYDDTLVEPSEYRLIADLEKVIKAFLKRWHVTAYTLIDELYLPTILGVLFSYIPNQITNIRISKIKTNEVHSFFLEHFFRSNSDLWDDVQVLKKKTIYWLYQNLPYLQKHIGKQETLDLIIDKIFNNNNTGVGTYNLILPDPVLNKENEDNVNVTSFDNQEIVATSLPLNTSYTIDTIETKTLEEFVILEETGLEDVKPVKDSNILTYDVDHIKNLLTNQRHNTVRTKALTVGIVKLFEANGLDIIGLILDHWCYAVKNDMYDGMVDYSEPNTIIMDSGTVVDFIEPNSNQYFTITPKIGLLFLIKQLLYITGNKDLKLDKITFTNVSSTDLTRYDTIVNNSYKDGYSTYALEAIKSILPKPIEKMKTVNSFNTYLTDIINYYRTVWTIDSNTENSLVSSNIKNVVGKMLASDELSLLYNNESLTIDELLGKYNKQYIITDNFDLYQSMTVLIKSFTGLDIDPYLKIRNRLTSLTNILNKLTSYTIQVINPDVNKENISLYYNNINSIHAIKGLVAVLESDLIQLEQNYVFINAVANDFRDILTSMTFSYNPRVGSCEKPISGFAEIETSSALDFIVKDIRPKFTVTIQDEILCDIKDMEHKDKFLIGLSGDIIPLEKEQAMITTVASSPKDVIRGVYNKLTNVIAKEATEAVVGSVEMDTEEQELSIVVNSPKITIDISDENDFIVSE